MNRQQRRIGSEVRATEENGDHFITLRAITPGVVDDYGSMWKPDTFDRALADRLPTLAWGHNWQEPIGRAVSFETSKDGPSIRFKLSDFEAVPLAKRAFVQTQEGVLDDCSVGFSNVTRREPSKDERTAHPGAKEIIEDADLDEVSLVLRGAVPGAKVLALRSRGGATVPTELVIELAEKVAAGEISREAADIALDLASDEAEPTPPPEPEASDVDAEIDAALAERSRP